MKPRRLRPLAAYTAAALVLLLAAPRACAWLGEQSPAFAKATAPFFHKPSAWIALVLAVWTLCVAIDLGLRVPRSRLALPLCLVVWWCAVERCAAPYLIQPLRLEQLANARDPDHRPRNAGPGWNSDNLRGTAEAAEFRPAGFNLVFLGDSFAYGFLVDAAEAFPALVGRELARRRPELGVQVANFAWTSSSPLLSWRRLVDLGERYSPDLVVLCIDMSDFGDDLKWRGLLERRGAYATFDDFPIAWRAFQALAPDAYRRFVAWTAGDPPRRYFACEQPLDASRPHLAVLEAHVAGIAAWCASRGVGFALVVLPRAFQYDAAECPRNWEAGEYTVLGPHSLEPFRWFDELRARVDHPVISLLEDFRRKEVFPTCFEQDSHWNPAGHAVAARALVRELEPLLVRPAPR